MPSDLDKRYDDLDMKIPLGNVLFNILYLRLVNLQPHISNHCHSSYEVHFICSGKGKLRVQRGIYDLFPGTFYVTGPGIYHMQDIDPSDPMVEYCLNFEIIPSGTKPSKDLDKPLMEDINTIIESLSKTNFWFGKDEYDSIKLFDGIIKELENQFTGYYLHVQYSIIKILINMARSYILNKKSLYPLPKKIPYDSRRYIMDQSFLNKCSTLTPDELAKEAGVCRRQLNRIMQKYYSATFNQKLAETRLQIAREYLANSQLSIEEIAEKVGFSSSSYFCRVFKEHYAMTPSQFRELNRGI